MLPITTSILVPPIAAFHAKLSLEEPSEKMGVECIAKKIIVASLM